MASFQDLKSGYLPEVLDCGKHSSSFLNFRTFPPQVPKESKYGGETGRSSDGHLPPRDSSFGLSRAAVMKGI